MRYVLALFLVLGLTVGSFAKVPPAVTAKVKKIVNGKAKIMGVEPLPIKGLYVVFLKTGERVGSIVVSEDGKYVVLGTILKVEDTKRPENVVVEIGKKKGYLKPPAPRKVDMSAIDLKGTPRIGKKDAPAIVLYFDPTCPFCKRELATLRDMEQKGEIAFYPKYFIVHGKKAREKAIEAECIREAHGNKAYYDYILEGKKPSKAVKCDRKAIEKRISRDEKEAVKLGIRGTPTWIYNGKMYVGYRPEKEIKRIIDKGKK